MEPQGFLGKLQSAPHETKVRWLLALSVVAMAIVIWVWISALPAMVAIAPPSTEANPNPKPHLTGVASLLQSFGNNQ